MHDAIDLVGADCIFEFVVIADISFDKWNLGFLAETERQVVRHLEGHLDRLPAGDSKSRAIVEQMRSVNTQGIVPMSHPVDAMASLRSLVADADEHGMSLRLRDDVISEPNQRDANMHNAPAQERGLFLVPKVIE